MILKGDSSEQKLSGAYYTPASLAQMMVQLFSDDTGIEMILEPSCGDGVFVRGIIGSRLFEQVKRLDAVEINGAEVKKLRAGMKDYKNVHMFHQDFFEYYEKNKDKKKYDLVLGNPPYIRYQYLEEEQRTIMSELLKSHGMKANKLINTWVGFLVACVHMLKQDGKIAFVIPAEIMQVAYAEDLRLFLADNLSKITLVTFEELVFPDIEQEIVVFIGEKGEQEKGIRIIELNNLDDFMQLDPGLSEFQHLSHVHEKWTKYFTNSAENELIQQIKEDGRFRRLSDAALVNVGITTGNNKYFSVDKSIVEDYHLEEVVRPLIGRSSHAGSVYFEKNDWLENVRKKKAAYLIDFPDRPYEEYPQRHKDYIKMGEEKEEDTGYKCSIRERWYRIPSIWVPDAFFLRRNNLYPKFVLNRCDAVSTDTMHRIQFYPGMEPERIALSYYNSISFAFTEICGRSYGGGVLEILPGEAGNIILPKLEEIPLDVVRDTLEKIDEIVRKDENIEKALDIVDSEILEKRLGVEERVCAMARGIWKKLQKRRLKRG